MPKMSTQGRERTVDKFLHGAALQSLVVEAAECLPHDRVVPLREDVGRAWTTSTPQAVEVVKTDPQ